MELESWARRIRLMGIHQKLHVARSAAETAQRKLFVSIQIAKAAVGAVLAAGFLMLIGRPDLVETIALALIVISFIQACGLLPASRLPFLAWQIYAASIFAAVIQAGLVAAAAQDRQRAADLAAAEGAAMYRFLADNAMDLITRHTSDG